METKNTKQSEKKDELLEKFGLKLYKQYTEFSVYETTIITMHELVLLKEELQRIGYKISSIQAREFNKLIIGVWLKE